LEPTIRSKEEFKVLYSPEVSTTNPNHYIISLATKLNRLTNVRIYLACRYKRILKY